MIRPPTTRPQPLTSLQSKWHRPCGCRRRPAANTRWRDWSPTKGYFRWPIPPNAAAETGCFGMQFTQNAAHVVGDCPFPIVGERIEGLPFVAQDGAGAWGLVPVPSQVAIFLGDFDQGSIEDACALSLTPIAEDMSFTYQGAEFSGLTFTGIARASGEGFLDFGRPLGFNWEPCS